MTADSENVLFTANYTKLYRHSFFADYYIFNVKDKTTTPLVADQHGGETPENAFHGIEKLT